MTPIPAHGADRLRLSAIRLDPAPKPILSLPGCGDGLADVVAGGIELAHPRKPSLDTIPQCVSIVDVIVAGIDTRLIRNSALPGCYHEIGSIFSPDPPDDAETGQGIPIAVECKSPPYEGEWACR